MTEIEGVYNHIHKLESEIESLKAKLFAADETIEWLKADNEELKSKLSAQDWHDASELPTEEGDYLIWSTNTQDYIIGDCSQLINREEAIKLLKEYSEWDKPLWKHITLPEGK